MKLYLKLAAVVVFFGLAVWLIRSDPGGSPASAASMPGPPPGDASWRRAALWDDGNAEFCAYEVRWPRYGHAFAGRALLVLVKEPWAPDLDVKADRPRADGFDVLKLNHVRDVATGIYTYHQMASVYLRRDDALVRKIAATSSEACGVTTASMVRGRLATHSYFDGQGDREIPWPAGALAEDGLPAELRDYVTGPVPATLSVFPSLMSSQATRSEPLTYRIERRAAGAVEVPAGRFQAVELHLSAPDSTLSYSFETDSPHRLIRFAGESKDGGTLYELAKCERIPYWKLHNPGDEAWLPAAVR